MYCLIGGDLVGVLGGHRMLETCNARLICCSNRTFAFPRPGVILFEDKDRGGGVTLTRARAHIPRVRRLQIPI